MASVEQKEPLEPIEPAASVEQQADLVPSAEQKDPCKPIEPAALVEQKIALVKPRASVVKKTTVIKQKVDPEKFAAYARARVAVAIQLKHLTEIGKKTRLFEAVRIIEETKHRLETVLAKYQTGQEDASLEAELKASNNVIDLLAAVSREFYC